MSKVSFRLISNYIIVLVAIVVIVQLCRKLTEPSSDHDQPAHPKREKAAMNNKVLHFHQKPQGKLNPSHPKTAGSEPPAVPPEEEPVELDSKSKTETESRPRSTTTVNPASVRRKGEFYDDSYDKKKFSELSHLYTVKDVDCRAVMEGDKLQMADAVNKSKTKEYQGFRLDVEYYSNQKSCQKFIQERGYITSSLTQREKDFPLAYSIMAYRSIEQLERLLRSIYRPQNIYCIHIDKKSHSNFYNAVEWIADCFENVFMARTRVDVKWGRYSVLEQELVCIEELYERRKDWKYFINLTGEEVALKSNKELVEILTAYKGANDIEGVSMTRSHSQDRWKPYLPVPNDLTPVKGGVHVALNFDMIEFIVTDHRAKELREWLKMQFAPEETFFATLAHNPKLGIRGIFMGLNDVEEIMDRKPWYGRYKSWDDWPCAGTRSSDVCILSTGDLPHIHSSPFFFANKFYLNEDQIVYTCLEQRLFNQTRDLHLGRLQVNTTLYEQSIIVRHGLRVKDKKLITHPIGEGWILELLKSRQKRKREIMMDIYKKHIEGKKREREEKEKKEKEKKDKEALDTFSIAKNNTETVEKNH